MRIQLCRTSKLLLLYTLHQNKNSSIHYSLSVCIYLSRKLIKDGAIEFVNEEKSCIGKSEKVIKILLC